MLDVSEIKSLQAIADSGSLNKAAKVLNLSQPALSKRVRRLEDRLRNKLFYRGRQGMVPTAYAHRILSLSERLMRTTSTLTALITAIREHDDERIQRMLSQDILD